jgi:PPOX class probable F420-dependent enzyme
MPKPPLPAGLDRFLTEANPAVIASVRADGSPHSAATWYIWEDGRVLVNMDETRKRLQYLRDDPRVSITVLGKDQWYRQVTLQCRVASIEPDPDLADIDRLSRHYVGNDYGDRERTSVSAWLKVESWYAWNMGQFWDGSE